MERLFRKKELENLTAMYIEAVEIVAKTIVIPVKE